MVNVGYLVAVIGMGRHLYESLITYAVAEAYLRVLLPIRSCYFVLTDFGRMPLLPIRLISS